MDIVIRFGVAILIGGAGVGLYLAITRLRLAALRHEHRNRGDPGLDNFRQGVPAILYFTTPDCAPCQTVQGPAVEALRAQLGEQLQVIIVDASERTDLANHWDVLSVPTTFILDAQGKARHINNGVTPTAKLRQQLDKFVGLGGPIDLARQATRD